MWGFWPDLAGTESEPVIGIFECGNKFPDNFWSYEQQRPLHKGHFTKATSQTPLQKRHFTKATSQTPLHKRHFTKATPQRPLHKRHFTNATSQTPLHKGHFTNATSQTPLHKRHFTKGTQLQETQSLVHCTAALLHKIHEAYVYMTCCWCRRVSL